MPELRAALASAGVDPDRAIAALSGAPPRPPTAPVEGWTRAILTALGLQLGQDLCATGGWAVLGAASVAGTIDPGLVTGWALLVLTALLLRLAASATTARIGVSVGVALRRRLLQGALARDPRAVAMDGPGRLLARAVEAQRLETFGLASGAGVLLAVGEIAIAGAILAATAPSMLVLLAGMLGVLAVQVVRLYGRATRAAAARAGLTQVLTEELLGHRTRLVQCPPGRAHEAEVDPLDAQLQAQVAVDEASVGLSARLPRLWLAGAILLLPFAPTLAALGGVLLAWQALGRLAAVSAELVGAAVAWREVRGLLSTEAPAVQAATTPATVDLQLRGVRFGWGEVDTLRGVDLDVPAGARVLLEGPSGAGKSTLALLLAGLVRPRSGVILAGGLDRGALGAAGWRQRVVAAPQFHQNHVFHGSFAFNVLLGRAWPAGEAELVEAARVCRELGLGPLIDRMPSGFFEVVGETGWQLSHGERSRLFLARALVRRAPVVVLDESFGALDPATLRVAVDAARRHAGTLIVVAHP